MRQSMTRIGVSLALVMAGCGKRPVEYDMPRKSALQHRFDALADASNEPATVHGLSMGSTPVVGYALDAARYACPYGSAPVQRLDAGGALGPVDAYVCCSSVEPSRRPRFPQIQPTNDRGAASVTRVVGDARAGYRAVTQPGVLLQHDKIKDYARTGCFLREMTVRVQDDSATVLRSAHYYCNGGV